MSGRSPTARVADAVDDAAPDIIDLLSRLIRIPSVSGSPSEVTIQAELASVLAADGLEVDHWPIPLAELAAEREFPGTEVPRGEAWGLVGRLPGREGGQSIMFDCHVDVVPPGDRSEWHRDPFGGTVEDGRVWGRGACDMKGGLAAALLAVRALRRSGAPLRGDVLIACVAGEEDGGVGTYATLRRGWRADACVIPEPTGLAAVPANAGALTFRLRVPGLSAHASVRADGVSAVEKLWPVFRALRDLEHARSEDADPLMARWTIPYPIEIGTVRGGDWPSSVPGELVAEGRLGVMLDESLVDARRTFEEAITAACAADPWLRDHPVSVEWWGGRFAPARLPASSGLLDRLKRACAAASAPAPEVWGAPFGSDLRLLTALGGIPTLQYGPGDLALAHAPNESVRIQDVVTAARVLALLALEG